MNDASEATNWLREAYLPVKRTFHFEGLRYIPACPYCKTEKIKIFFNDVTIKGQNFRYSCKKCLIAIKPIAMRV